PRSGVARSGGERVRFYSVRNRLPAALPTGARRRRAGAAVNADRPARAPRARPAASSSRMMVTAVHLPSARGTLTCWLGTGPVSVTDEIGHYARSGAAGKVFIEEISPRRHPGVETAGTRGFRQVNPGHAPGGGTTTSSPRTIASTAGPYAWSLAAPMPRRNPSWRRSLGRASAMAA